MSSPESAAQSTVDELPPALRSMWRLVKLGYRHEPGLLVAAFLLSLLAALPDALIAVWLTLLGEGVLRADRSLLFGAAVGLAASAAATWFLRTVSTRVQRRFRDRVTIALEGHVARLQASVVTIAHQERPALLDRLAVLRDQVFVLDHMYMSVFSTCGWILRLAITVVLLMSVHPALALLVLFALPTVLTSSWRPGRRAVGRRARRPGEPPGAAPVPHRHHGRARQGGSAHRHRPPTRTAASRRVGTLVRRWSRRRGGAARSGTPWPGPCSVPATSARSCTSPPC